MQTSVCIPSVRFPKQTWLFAEPISLLLSGILSPPGRFSVPPLPPPSSAVSSPPGAAPPAAAGPGAPRRARHPPQGKSGHPRVSPPASGTSCGFSRGLGKRGGEAAPLVLSVSAVCGNGSVVRGVKIQAPAMDGDTFHKARLLRAPSGLALNI